MRSLVVPLLLLTVAVAGCNAPADTPMDTTEDGTTGYPPLHGWVFNEALAPLSGVEIEVLEAGAIATSDQDGFYAFAEGLPTNEPLILVARMDGFKPRSQQVTLPDTSAVRLNFTLAAEPIKVATKEVLPWEGFLNCQYNVDVSGDQNLNSCGAGTDEDQWQFPVGPDLAGVVLEISWTANSDLSKYLHARLETQNVSDQTLVLSETTGESVLRLQVAEEFARKYYPAGGIMRLTVSVDPNNAETENEAGAALAVSQSFKAFASLFYVNGPPQGYSAGG